MGTVHAEITIQNAYNAAQAKRGKIAFADIREMSVRAIVDTGADTLIIPDEIRLQLGLEIDDEVAVEFADGRAGKYYICEAVDIRLKTRSTIFRPIAIPGATEILLGALPLEAMDVIINPELQEIDVPPERPYLPRVRIL